MDAVRLWMREWLNVGQKSRWPTPVAAVAMPQAAVGEITGTLNVCFHPCSSAARGAPLKTCPRLHAGEEGCYAGQPYFAGH